MAVTSVMHFQSSKCSCLVTPKVFVKDIFNLGYVVVTWRFYAVLRYSICYWSVALVLLCFHWVEIGLLRRRELCNTVCSSWRRLFKDGDTVTTSLLTIPHHPSTFNAWVLFLSAIPFSNGNSEILCSALQKTLRQCDTWCYYVYILNQIKRKRLIGIP